MPHKKVKVGLNAGAGPPPGYSWSVFVLEVAFRDASRIFDEAQYRHLVLQVQELAGWDDPTHCATVSVDAVEDYFELRERGGVLGGKNARVFWGLDKDSRAIVVLGAIVKQNNGSTPQGDIIRMRRRWRKYQHGDYGRVNQK